jgi:hypothetical protein
MTTMISRAKPLIAIAGGIAALLTVVSLAPAGEPRSRFRNPPATAAQTRIEVDRNTNAIRFYVEGKQVALIDSRGLN